MPESVKAQSLHRTEPINRRTGRTGDYSSPSERNERSDSDDTATSINPARNKMNIRREQDPNIRTRAERILSTPGRPYNALTIVAPWPTA